MSILFGPFELWPERRELRRDGRPVQLGGRALQLLSILVQRAGEVIGRAELSGCLWPDGGVDDSSLRAHVAALRKALGQERYILNVLGRGYTFVGSCRPSAAAALPAPAPPPAPLPAALPALGREDAIALLGQEVQRRRLVSVVGAGGLGKSTVARAVAASAAAAFDGRVYLVDLAPLVDAEAAIATIAAALGLATPADTQALGRLLLVIDNGEHLADALAAYVEGLLAGTLALHLLVTSREALSLQEEWVYRLAPLGLADDGADDPDCGASPAARLFAMRAAAAGLRLEAADAGRVARLCRQLDGNPLAIELAAAEAGAAGLAALEAEPARLLAPGRRRPGTDPRHRTLATMLDWSVELLAPHERAVLRRLAVFHGPFTLDWAAEVCACARIGPAVVVESILALSARSLVNVASGGMPPRYRLANTTRLYAQQQLLRTPEAPALLRRHAASVTALCLRADADLQRLAAPEWRARYAGLSGELAAALDWCFGPAGDTPLGIELAAAARFVMGETGDDGEARRQILRALRALARQERPDAGLEAGLLAALTVLDAHFLDDGGCEDAAWARSRLLALAEAGEQAALAYQAIAGWALGQGRYPVVLEMAGRIAACASRAAEPEAAVLANRLRAQGLHYLGRHEEALALARTALANAPPRRSAHCLSKVPVPVSMGVLVARTLWIRGLPDQAQEVADQTLARAEGQHPHALCMALGLAALPVALWRGDTARAGALAGRFGALAEGAGSAFWQPWCDSFLRLLDAAPGGHGPAPANSVLRDLLATFGGALADEDCLRRVRAGLVGWNAPEVLRAAGLRRLARGGVAAEAAQLFLEARALARAQGALGWELRAAISLAELEADREPGENLRENLREALVRLLARFDEGFASADLVRARALLGAAAPRPAGGALWCAALLGSS